MDTFESRGRFWLPASPDSTASGVLSFDGAQVRLVLDHELDGPHGPMGPTRADRRPKHKVVLGVLFHGQRNVTLLGLLCLSGVAWAGGTTTWDCSEVLDGEHVAVPVFDLVSFSFDVLTSWSQPPPLSFEKRDQAQAGEPWLRVLDMRPQTVSEIALPDSRIRLIARADGEAGGESVRLQRVTTFVADEFEGLSLQEVMQRYVAPLQHLMIVLLGRPVRLTRLNLRPVSQADGTYGARRPWVSVAIGSLVQPVDDGEASWSSLRSWGHPTMFVREELPIDAGSLIAGWLEIYPEMRDVVSRLCARFEAPFMYSEQRYALAFQAAEGFAKRHHGGTQLPRAAHRARVDQIVRAARDGGVAEADVEWAESVLRGRNDKPLESVPLGGGF